MPPTVNIVDPATGKTFGVDEAEAARLEGEGWRREGGARKAQRLTAERKEAEYGDTVGKITAVGAGAVRTVTGGISDAVFRGLGVEDEFRDLKEVNPGASMVGEIAGAFVPIGAVGLASRAGSAVAKTAEGASVLAKIGRGAAGMATEGVVLGAGSGVSEVALAKDDKSLEEMVATIGSSALFGGAVGGGVGLVAKGAGAALRRGKQALDDFAAKAATGEVDDVTRKAFVDEFKAFRKTNADDELFLITKGAADRETKTLGKIWLEADKALDRTLRNPKALASEPKRVLAALQQQEHAFEQVIAKTDDFTAKFAADTSGTRATALQKVPAALEQNRALQAKIAEMTAKPAASAGGGLAQNMLSGQAFGLGASLVGAIPVIGPLLAPMAGAAASKLVTEGLQKAVTKQAARMSKAVDTFLTVGAKVAPVVPVASRTLASVSYGKTDKKHTGTGVAATYKARVAEVKAQTEYDMTGRAVMRADARQRVYDNLAPLRAGDPIGADRMESLAARRIEAIANRIPRRPDLAGVPHGPDRWQPSDMEMRGWARFAHAVEDPAGVVERLAAGTITPEDADAMREVYPELYSQIQTQILAKLPTLRATLPYQRRLALSIFSGIPVDPSMDPKVLSVLQQSFAEESEPQMPTPQFGSVKNHEATPAQERQMPT